MKKVKVFGWSKDADRNIIGKYNSKPMLNTMLYYVDFPNGAIRKYGSNIISDNIYSQVDSEGFCTPSSLEPLIFSKITLSSRKATNIS